MGTEFLSETVSEWQNKVAPLDLLSVPVKFEGGE